MTKLTDRRKVTSFIWLCTLVYFVSYVSRVNLSATLVEVVGSSFAAKTTAALALTVCSITYGAGQILSGYLGDRCKPQNLIITGFAITGFVNACVGALPSDTLLVPLWGINGFAQSLMWPPLVAILTANLSQEDYQVACVRVSWGSSFGTIAVYLFSPLVIGLLNIRWVFFLSAAAAFVMLIVWKLIFDRNYSSTKTESPKARPAEPAPSARFDAKALAITAAIIICIVLQGFLRDGVTSWTPSYISDTFRLSSTASILSGVILPLFSVASFQLASVIYRKIFKNELLCAAVIFLAGCLSAALLMVFNGKNMILSLLCLALLVGSMHGVNLILICMVPPHFAKFGRVSLISGVLNSGTYIGSAISAYGTAVFTEAFGWNSTILLWSATALLGAAACFLLKSKWSRFKA